MAAAGYSVYGIYNFFRRNLILIRPRVVRPRNSHIYKIKCRKNRQREDNFGSHASTLVDVVEKEQAQSQVPMACNVVVKRRKEYKVGACVCFGLVWA